MRFRDDILRGLRLGAILLAAILIGVVVYRILREAPAPAAKPQRTKVASIPANGAPFVVPAPPPTGTPGRKRHPSAPALTQPPDLAESGAKAEDDAACTATSPMMEQEKEGPDAAAEKDTAASAPATGGEVTTTQGSRGKRWLRAVGHFLHIGSRKGLQP